MESQLLLAIVPQGTGNLLARTLGLPLTKPGAALDIAATGVPRRVDVLSVEVTDGSGATTPHLSVVLSGVGIDAAMVAHTQPELKRRFGWVAYVDGVLRSLPRLRPFAARVTVAGEQPRNYRATAVLVANLADLPGGLSLAPGAAIDDGQLDLVVLQPRHWWDWLRIWRHVGWDNRFRRGSAGRELRGAEAGPRGHLVTARGRAVDIELLGGPQAFQIDGDPAGEAQRISVRVNPHGIKLLVPNGSTSAWRRPVNGLRPTR
jgi:diacylglycerol kinase family enzyme